LTLNPIKYIIAFKAGGERHGPIPLTVKTRTLTAAQYDRLADVPPEAEWLANITNKKTQRAYKIDVGEFWSFAGLTESAQLRTVTRAHVIAWRKVLQGHDCLISGRVLLGPCVDIDPPLAEPRFDSPKLWHNDYKILTRLLDRCPLAGPLHSEPVLLGSPTMVPLSDKTNL
jgi:hypothetical protein